MEMYVHFGLLLNKSRRAIIRFICIRKYIAKRKLVVN